jgi:hypothetical protein
MINLKSLYDGAKSAGASVISIVGERLGDIKKAMSTSAVTFVDGVKKNISKMAIKHFGADFIDAGAEILEEQITGSISPIMNQLLSADPLKLLKKSNESLEDQFGNLLNKAQNYLDEQSEEANTTPLKKSGIKLASRLIQRGNEFKRNFSKLTAKGLKEFQEELEDAKPQLEKELTKFFVNLFIVPIISFLVNLLKSLFPTEQASQERTRLTDARRSPSPAVPVYHSEVNEQEHEEVSDEQDAPMMRTN